nr:hypothetical protein CFP56_73754 [Quercus suber]
MSCMWLNALNRNKRKHSNAASLPSQILSLGVVRAEPNNPPRCILCFAKKKRARLVLEKLLRNARSRVTTFGLGRVVMMNKQQLFPSQMKWRSRQDSGADTTAKVLETLVRVDDLSGVDVGDVDHEIGGWLAGACHLLVDPVIVEYLVDAAQAAGDVVVDPVFQQRAFQRLDLVALLAEDVAPILIDVLEQQDFDISGLDCSDGQAEWSRVERKKTEEKTTRA